MKVYDERPHVFVMGSARSGTSLCSSIIKSSPEFASYHAETKLLRDCAVKYGRLSNSKSRSAFFEDWLDSRQFKRSGISDDEARQLVYASEDYYAFLSSYMGLMAAMQGCERWLDGTPDNIYVVDRIMHAFPNAKIIHMLRDGRAVAASLAKLGWTGVKTGNFDTGLLYSALKWEIAATSLRDFSSTIAGQYLEVRYEDLANNPQQVTAQLCEFLDIPLIDYDAMLEDANGNIYSTLSNPNTPYTDLASGISTSAIDRWKKVLTPEQQASVEAYIGDTLEELGYERVTDARLSPAAALLRNWRKFNLRARRLLKEKTPLGHRTVSPLEIGAE